MKIKINMDGNQHCDIKGNKTEVSIDINSNDTDTQVKALKEILTDDFMICDEPSFFPSYRKKSIERIKKKKK